jgi:phosphoribosylformimino-5-aminoimidazole carboxamide ribonucleotide (ProFAR) isomerase
MSGPNVDLCRDVARATPALVIASGGVSTTSDLALLAKAATVDVNLEGVIVGKALYANRFTLREALETIRRVS